MDDYISITRLAGKWYDVGSIGEVIPFVFDLDIADTQIELNIDIRAGYLNQLQITGYNGPKKLMVKPIWGVRTVRIEEIGTLSIIHTDYTRCLIIMDEGKKSAIIMCRNKYISNKELGKLKRLAKTIM